MTKPQMKLPAMVTGDHATGAPVGDIRANRWTMKEGGKQVTAYHASVKLDAKTALRMGVLPGTRLVVSLGIPLKDLTERPDGAELIAMAKANEGELQAYRTTQAANGIPQDVMDEARAILASRRATHGGAINPNSSDTGQRVKQGK